MLIRGGLVIKEMRQTKGYSQIRLAALYGVHKNTISGWETGDHEPSFMEVFNVGECLKYDIIDIYQLSNQIEQSRKQAA